LHVIIAGVLAAIIFIVILVSVVKMVVAK
jgi:hypothetical protein